MDRQKSEINFLLILLAGILVLTFFIFKPFLYALALAIVFATVFAPLHRKVFKITRERKSLAALLSTAAVLVIVVAPLSFLGVQLFKEAGRLYSYLAFNGGTVDFTRSFTETLQGLEKIIPVKIDFKINFDVGQYARQGLNWLLANLGPLFTNAARMLLGVFIFLTAIYYLFKDGQKLKQAVISLSPLKDNRDEMIFHNLGLAINSVIRGNITVAIVQGILTVVGFSIFGVPSAVLWGGVAAVAALIPGVGTALVIVPAIIYLFLAGKTFFALGLLGWGLTAVGLVDNFLGPKLVGRGTQLHPFLVLLSILGGIAFFGPLGFLLGPLTLSLLFALFEIYFSIRKEFEGK